MIAADQYYCSGGCYPVTCGTLAVLKCGAAPTIMLSAEANDALDSSLELVLTYATSVAFNLLPCPSTGGPCHQAQHCLLLCVMLHLSLSIATYPPESKLVFDLHPACRAHQQSPSACGLSSNALGNLIHRHGTPPDCHWSSYACIKVCIGVLGCCAYASM